MKKKIIFIITFIVINLLNFQYSYAESDEGLNFVVNIIQPHNQTKKDINYFDLLIQPNETQKIELEITNTGNKVDTFQVTPTNAVTSTNGALDYSIKPDTYKYDNTLKIPFTTLISKKQSVKINPKETKKISFDLQSPKQNFNGIILGGFVISSLEDEKNNKKDEKVTFINKFQMIKAVVLRNNDKSILPDFTLNTVKPSLYNYRTAVTANIQNTSPLLLKKVQINAYIYKKGSNIVVKSEKRNDIEFAPNSNFDFPIMWDNEPLESGTYNAKIEVVANGKKFNFDKEFKISKEASYKINSEAIDLKETTNNTLLIFSLVIICCLLLVILYILFYKNLKKRKKRKKRKK